MSKTLFDDEGLFISTFCGQPSPHGRKTVNIEYEGKSICIPHSLVKRALVEITVEAIADVSTEA